MSSLLKLAATLLIAMQLQSCTYANPTTLINTLATAITIVFNGSTYDIEPGGREKIRGLFFGFSLESNGARLSFVPDQAILTEKASEYLCGIRSTISLEYRSDTNVYLLPCRSSGSERKFSPK